MSKSLLYRLFGLGKIPRRERPAIEAEGIVLLEEGLRGSVTLRHFSRPGRYSSWRKTGFSGSLAVTKKRIVGWAFSKKVFEIPIPNTHSANLQVTIEKNECLCIAFEASDFHQDTSGAVVLRFRTPEANRFMTWLTAKTT